MTLETSLRGSAWRAQLSRRSVLAGAGSLLVGGASADEFCHAPETSAEPIARGTPLGLVNPKLPWGVAVSKPGLNDAKLVDAIARERPAVLAIGNGCKFDHLYPQAPTSDGTLDPARWEECDAVVALAGRLGAGVRADCLAWNDWPPAWITALLRARPSRWRERLQGYFQQHFERVFTHLAELHLSGGAPILGVGLVNEPFEPWHVRGGVPAFREGAWLDAFGFASDGLPDYLHQALRLGERYAGPGTKLIVNEATAESDRFGPMMRPALLAMIDKLQKAGRRIDVLGLECHLVPQWMNDPTRPDWTPFAAFLDEVGRRGIEVQVTELDVNDCSLRASADRDRLVAETLRSFVGVVAAHPVVTSITSWDLSDRYSWLREKEVVAALPRWAGCSDPACPRPTLYDEAMRPKPARDALAQGLASRR